MSDREHDTSISLKYGKHGKCRLHEWLVYKCILQFSKKYSYWENITDNNNNLSPSYTFHPPVTRLFMLHNRSGCLEKYHLVCNIICTNVMSANWYFIYECVIIQLWWQWCKINYWLYCNTYGEWDINDR